MVAAHVGLNPSWRALTVRGTTLMPNKLCLGALLTMIFAPKVEVSRFFITFFANFKKKPCLILMRL